MKIQYCSDLHLEFPDNKKFLKTNPLPIKGDVLILAGDIVPFKIMDKHHDFFNYLSDNFKYTYWIPGNHEYYHYDLAQKGNVINEKIKENVFLVHNTSVQHDDVNFIFSTLWSKIRGAYEWQIERGMSDFHVIKHQGKRFSASQYNLLHQESLAFIKTNLEKMKSKKTLVASHHVPTFLNYPEEYKGDILNDAFAVELHDFIEKSNIDYWIFGHTHQNVADFKIGETNLRCNQLGYVKYGEHASFKNDKIINL